MQLCSITQDGVIFHLVDSQPATSEIHPFQDFTAGFSCPRCKVCFVDAVNFCEHLDAIAGGIACERVESPEPEMKVSVPKVMVDSQSRFCRSIMRVVSDLASAPIEDVNPDSDEHQLTVCFGSSSTAVRTQLQRLFESFTVFLSDSTAAQGLELTVVFTFLREYGFIISEDISQEMHMLGLTYVSFPWLLRIIAWILATHPGAVDTRFTTTGVISAQALLFLLPIEIDVPLQHIPVPDGDLTPDALVSFLSGIDHPTTQSTLASYVFCDAKGPFPARCFRGHGTSPQAVDLDRQIRFCHCTPVCMCMAFMYYMDFQSSHRIGKRCIATGVECVGLQPWRYLQVGLRRLVHCHLLETFPSTRTVLFVLARLVREFEFALRNKRQAGTKLKLVERIQFWCARLMVTDADHDMLISELAAQVRIHPVLNAKPPKPKSQCARCKKLFSNLKQHLKRKNPCQDVEETSDMSDVVDADDESDHEE